MKVVKKVYKFMDNLFLDKYNAVRSSKGWEHKDKVKTVYIVIDQNELKEIEELKAMSEQFDAFNFLSPETFDNIDQAIEEMETENSFL